MFSVPASFFQLFCLLYLPSAGSVDELSLLTTAHLSDCISYEGVSQGIGGINVTTEWYLNVIM